MHLQADFSRHDATEDMLEPLKGVLWSSSSIRMSSTLGATATNLGGSPAVTPFGTAILSSTTRRLVVPGSAWTDGQVRQVRHRPGLAANLHLEFVESHEGAL